MNTAWSSRNRQKKMVKIKQGTSRLNATQLVDKSKYIEERMQGNPDFPDPVPALADIATARTALEDAITAAMDGGRTATAIRRARSKELKLLLGQLAGHVSSLAEGNEVAIRSSGFEVRRTPSPVGELPAPVGLKASISAHAGRVDLRWDPVKHAVAYDVFKNGMDPADASAWERVDSSTRASYSVTGLAPASTTWFRVSAVGTAGTGPVSDVAHSLAK